MPALQAPGDKDIKVHQPCPGQVCLAQIGYLCHLTAVALLRVAD